MGRRSKEELIAEFHRVYDVFETLNACMGPIYGRELADVINQEKASRERMLGWLSDGKATTSQLLSGTQQALNETMMAVEKALEEWPESAQLVLKAYEKQSGRKLFDDTGSPRKFAFKIVERGYIENETEFYLLKEVMNDVDQSVFKEPQATKAHDMLHRYEMDAKQ